MTLGAAETPESQSAVLSYCRRLNSVLNNRCTADCEQLKSVLDFQLRMPEKFNDLARVHLSFLIDLPHFELDSVANGDNNNNNNSSSSNNFCRKLRKRSCNLQLPGSIVAGVKRGRRIKSGTELSGSQSTKPSAHSSISEFSSDRIGQLITHLEQQNHYKAEGIFRKTGSCSRQKELKRQLLSQTCSSSSSSSLTDYTVHDVANVIKQLLRCLEEPLLSDRLCEILMAVSDLSSPRYTDKGVQLQRNKFEQMIVTCRQLKAARILLMLMPIINAKLMSRLLNLLKLVADAAEETRMNAENLGKIFGPVLFSVKALESAAANKRLDKLNQIATFLIEHSHQLQEVPRSFADDVCRNAAAFADNRDRRGVDEADVAPGVRFSQPGCQSTAGQQDNYGRLQLQQLLAHISQLPDSREKRKLERRLEQHAVCCTPERFCSFRKRLSAARSFGRLCGDSTDESMSDAASSTSSCRSPAVHCYSSGQHQHQHQHRFFHRDRRLLRALSSIRVYKSQRRQLRQLEQLRARLSFESNEEETATAAKRCRLTGARVSSPKLTFTDAADTAASSPSPKSTPSRQSRQLSCSTIFESPSDASSRQATSCSRLLARRQFLQTAL